MSNYELNAIFNAIKDSVRDISILMRKSNPCQLGSQLGSDNSSGDKVKSLDIESNNIMKQYMSNCPYICRLASEEDDNTTLIDPNGHYFVSFDPLDGSSNIDSNITTGTIYCVFRYNDNNDILSGRQIVMAGYSVYGGSTLLVNCIEGLVQIYGLDPDSNNWNLLNNDVEMKQAGSIYAINESNKYRYRNSINHYICNLITNGYTARWVGSLVADVHRTLIKGGVMMYPSNTKHRNGRIRLLYEAYPMAYIIESAGGLAYDENSDLLDAQFPLENDIHMKTPIYVGSSKEMELLVNYL
tara:strand:+ start:448 stop:1341 length:894 start_codon:yes stop_codon:yes gene_type:complete